jgi:putative addiction module component (TIGR02574 family)
MATAHDELLQQLLTLPPDDRARLAEQLLESLETPDEQNSALWAEEAEERLDAYEAGKLKSVSGEEVFDRLKSKFRDK